MKLIFRSILFTLVIISCKNSPTDVKIHNRHNDIIEHKIDSLLNIMTIEEKVGQMNQYNGFWDATGPTPKEGNAAKKYEHLRKGWVGSMLAVTGAENVKAIQKIVVEESRLGIPLVIGFDVIHGFKTLSPIPIAESASWDLEAIQKSARMAATEAASAGINWTFAPMVDISRDPRWGRVMEGGGEDPFLGSKIAVARIQGFQGDDLNAVNTIASTAKHFAAYGFSESGKEYNTVEVSDATLHNVVLPPFEAAVNAGVKSVMNSFNEINGVPATGSNYLQRDILKGKWGFDGFVISDWASIDEMTDWGYAKDLKEASKLAVIAGSDMDMESYAYVEHLAKLVKDGEVDETLVDDAVRRILRVKFELGLFENPYKYCDETREKATIGSPEIHASALDMAKKSIVLLKNENNILPLKKSGQKIALIGALASDKDSPLGNWRMGADSHTAVSVLEGMQADTYKGNKLVYKQGAVVSLKENSFLTEVYVNETDKNGFGEAVNAAKNADVVVMVLGEVGFQSGEARSRTSLGLPGVQQELLETVYKANKNVVLVLTNGRPLTINWADENVPAIVEAWQLGTQAGNAIAQVLYGDYNPSGKLPMTFPRNVGQIPLYYNYKNTGRPVSRDDNVFYAHYIDSKQTPLYPFGYGLSYSTFEYSGLTLNKVSTSVNNPKIEVSVNVKNTSKVDGKEVVQLYIRDLFASVIRPVKELKGFELVEIKAGETRTISFTLDKSKLGFFNNDGDFIIEAGDFKVFVGENSVSNLTSNFELK